MRSYNPVKKGHSGQIRKALQLLLSGQAPCISTPAVAYCWAMPAKSCATLVDMLGYPVTHTLMGLGAYPASDKKYLGMLGMHGTD